MENVRKHKNIKHVITEKKILFRITTKLSYNNFFSENLLAIDLRKWHLIMDRFINIRTK